MPNEVDTSELDALQRAMDQLSGPLLIKFKGRTAYYVALAIKGVIQPYKRKFTPGNPPPYVLWASRKQQKWYHAMRRAAGLPAKYTRGSDPMSQRVSQSWAVSRGKTSATLGNRATYAPWVASEEFQTEQHAATGFTTDREAAEKVMKDGTVKRIIDAHLKAIVREAFRGLK